MNYTNIRLIMDRLQRHPLMSDINFETVIDYAVEFMKIVGTPPSFFEKDAEINIRDYRGELPCDFYEMIQVRTTGNSKHTFRYTTDSFHLSMNHRRHSDLTYKLQGNCIFTSIPDGIIEIAYRAIPTDDEGYPLIPDNSTFSRALELYIKLQWFTIQFDLGKITQQSLYNVQQQYSWAVGQAQTDLIRPTIDQMEAISNMWNKLLPDSTLDHKHGFVNMGTREHLINH